MYRHARHRSLLLGLAAVIGASYLLLILTAGHGLWQYVLAAIAGAALCLAVAFRESPPTWVEHYLAPDVACLSLTAELPAEPTTVSLAPVRQLHAAPGQS